MTVMKSGFAGLFFLYLSSTVCGLGSVVSRGYSYINFYYTWQEAQSYCRNLNIDSDLVIVYWQSEIEQLDMSIYNAWIGLHRETDENQTLDGWTWPSGEQLSFNAWAYREPYWGQRCGYVNYNSKRLGSENCENYFFFICNNSEFIPESKTWSEAKDYCQDKNQSLANFTDIYDINSHVNTEDFPVWIGLYRDGETWRWSAGISGYINWALDEPKNNGTCVSILSATKQMAVQNCSHHFPFLCYSNNLLLIKVNKTWEEALDHCRALRSPTHQEFRYDLVSVQPEDYNKIMAVVTEANTEEVWTGLRFLAGKWLWVNGADMKYSNLALCPPKVEHCGVLRKTSTGSIETRDCAERRNFVCYRK